jgi:hypothetical protein
MGCDIEWGGEPEVEALAHAAEAVLGASAPNDDDNDSGDEEARAAQVPLAIHWTLICPPRPPRPPRQQGAAGVAELAPLRPARPPGAAGVVELAPPRPARPPGAAGVARAPLTTSSTSLPGPQKHVIN